MKSRTFLLLRMLRAAALVASIGATLAGVTLGQPLDPQQRLGEANTVAYGVKVAASSELLAVGDHESSTGPGSVWIYERDASQPVGSQWVFADRLVANDTSIGMGEALALWRFDNARGVAGDWWLVAGDYQQSAVYVFKRDGSTGTWSQTQKLTGEFSYSAFGYSVSLHAAACASSGSSEPRLALAIGAPNHPGGGGVFTYELSSGVFGPTQDPLPIGGHDQSTGDYFGQDVSLWGDLLVVGAPRHQHAGAPSNAGAAYVFERINLTCEWSMRIPDFELLASDPMQMDWFGQAVAISGTHIAVGAPYADDVGMDAGKVYLFGHFSSNQEQQLLAFDHAGASNNNDHFGVDVELSARGVLAVGSEDEGFRGGIYLYRGPTDTLALGFSYSPLAKVRPAQTTSNDRFGRALALSHDEPSLTELVIAGGAQGENPVGSGSGAAYVGVDVWMFTDGFESGDTSEWTLTVP